MIRILWEYRVHPGSERAFVDAYAPTGEWARLFRRDAAFREVILLRDVEDPLRFVTVDVWERPGAFEEFRRRHAAEYDALDERCASLTESERRLGTFTAE